MKRSEIDDRIEQAMRFMDGHRFRLPPFARWSPSEWSAKGPEVEEIRSRRLGWDVTDFGLGDFDRAGLLLFTLRNGRLDDPANRKTFAEKIMVVRENQLTPWHFHWKKTEDIINRGGGVLVVELRNALADEGFADSQVVVRCDGEERRVPAGGRIELHPGQSVTLVPYLYHQFHARAGDGPALVGEVSSVNDDATDNRFNPPIGRFPTIEEDAPVRHLLCNEYPPACRGGGR